VFSLYCFGASEAASFWKRGLFLDPPDFGGKLHVQTAPNRA